MLPATNRTRGGLVQFTSVISIFLIIAASPVIAQSVQPSSTSPKKYSLGETYEPNPIEVEPVQTGHVLPNGYGPGESVILPFFSGGKFGVVLPGDKSGEGKFGALIYRNKDGELCFGFPMEEGIWGTGDWFTLRHKLVDNGVNITGGYTNNILGNVVGGKKLGFSYADQIYVQADLDMQKLIGWQGAHIVVTGLDRNGTNVSNMYTGNTFNPNQIYGSETVGLLMLYLEQNLFNGWVNIKAGRMAVTEDFGSSPLYGLYVNNGIDGQPWGLAGNAGSLSAWPAVVWGGRIRINDKKHNIYAMGGIYQTNANLYSPKSHGLDFGIHSTDGVTLVGEIGWTPEFQPHPKPSSVTDDSGKGTVDVSSTADNDDKWQGMPGHYKFGGYYTSWANIPTFDNSHPHGSYGLYWLFDQMVYQAKPGSEMGLTLWGSFILTPMQQVAIIPYDLSLGAIYTGLIPGRSHDKTAIAVHYGAFSNIYGDQEQALGHAKPTAEVILEACYTIQVSKCLVVQPDVQYIINPRGTSSIPNSLVLGAQISFNF